MYSPRSGINCCWKLRFLLCDSCDCKMYSATRTAIFLLSWCIVSTFPSTFMIWLDSFKFEAARAPSCLFKFKICVSKSFFVFAFWMINSWIWFVQFNIVVCKQAFLCSKYSKSLALIMRFKTVYFVLQTSSVLVIVKRLR